jgi:hypothetical protein
MSDILIVYCSFMYLLTIGIVSARASDKTERRESVETIGMVTHLLLAPLITPIVLGWLFYEGNE